MRIGWAGQEARAKVVLNQHFVGTRAFSVNMSSRGVQSVRFNQDFGEIIFSPLKPQSSYV